MNIKVLQKYKELLTKRLDKISLLDIGEDSIRYDFYIALSEIEKLEPSDLQLEYKINKKAFIPRNNENSKRKEKPILDLVVDTDKIKINVEFGLFRQNSNKNGTINKTYKTIKMLNDMIRLALDSNITKRDSYFVCVADKKMIGHRLKTQLLHGFPAKEYKITQKLIDELKKLNSSKKFDDRFLNVFKENTSINLITSDTIFNEEIFAKNIKMETRIIIWKITHN